MLKIKDNVDLKELEKYGFKEISFGYEKDTTEDEEKYTIHYFVDTKTKIIELYTYDGCDSYIDSTLYDLIKAD